MNTVPRYAMLAGLVSGLAVLGYANGPGTAKTPPLALRLSVPDPVVKVGEYPKFAATIKNNGSTSTTLVQPGDGSERGWRTPIAKFVITELDKTTGAALLTTSPGGPRCGNMNPLKASEVFDLAPGTSQKLENWLDFPPFTKPGRYRVALTYRNDPKLKSRGENFSPSDPKVIKRFESSQPCSLTSNSIVFVVTAK